MFRFTSGIPADARLLEEDAGLLAEGLLLSGSFEMSTVIGPVWRQATEKFEGSSLRPSGWPHPPLRACEMKQVTPGTLGSLTHTLSFGDSRLNVVLTHAKSSAKAMPSLQATQRQPQTSTLMPPSISEYDSVGAQAGRDNRG